MQLLFDYYKKRLPQDICDRLDHAVSHQNNLNPVERLHKGVYLVLKETLKEKDELKKLINYKMEFSGKGLILKLKEKRKEKVKRNHINNMLIAKEEVVLQLACLSCYLIPKMKASLEFIEVLKKINHPYIQLFVAYFEEDPSNYEETLQEVDKLNDQIEVRPDFTKEMKAFIVATKSWVYGHKGDVAELKRLYKYIKQRLPNTENIVEIRGSQDSASNIIWWLLHSGVEANVHEMIEYIEPYIEKYKLYMSYTDFLNLKGPVVSYLGWIHQV